LVSPSRYVSEAWHKISPAFDASLFVQELEDVALVYSAAAGDAASGISDPMKARQPAHCSYLISWDRHWSIGSQSQWLTVALADNNKIRRFANKGRKW
jgi:hypothetical protein